MMDWHAVKYFPLRHSMAPPVLGECKWQGDALTVGQKTSVNHLFLLTVKKLKNKTIYSTTERMK